MSPAPVRARAQAGSVSAQVVTELPMATTAPRSVSAASSPLTAPTATVTGVVLTAAPTGAEIVGVKVMLDPTEGESANVSCSTDDWPAASASNVHDPVLLHVQPDP